VIVEPWEMVSASLDDDIRAILLASGLFTEEER
jgi:hypothetical protein